MPKERGKSETYIQGGGAPVIVIIAFLERVTQSEMTLYTSIFPNWNQQFKATYSPWNLTMEYFLQFFCNTRQKKVIYHIV